jgi:hypothetical protein
MTTHTQAPDSNGNTCSTLLLVRAPGGWASKVVALNKILGHRQRTGRVARGYRHFKLLPAGRPRLPKSRTVVGVA